MPTIRKGPAPTTHTGKVRITLTVSPEESAAIDVARGTVPASTFCRDVVVKAVSK